MKPKIQVALDYSNAGDAIATAKNVGSIVDVIEVGTVLLIEEGSKPVSIIRELFPTKTILADPKCVDAGHVIAKNLASHGADAMTCVSAAEINTILSAKKYIDNVQIELFGEWTLHKANLWLQNDINHVIYHQSRDNDIVWGSKDINKIKELINMGFKVSVTGGLRVENLELFKNINVNTFIVGREITNATNQVESAQKFKEKIEELWSE